MSSSPDPTLRASSTPPAQRPHGELGTKSAARRDQAYAIVAGIVLLILATALQPIMAKRRSTLVRDTQTSLDSLAVNFPRLTLGGFRGLLAATLWIQAENDKTDRKWTQLETKYDIIGALEPYFTTVYVYHAWNQAYNLSAQWYDQDAKYRWVLDGLGYLYKGEEYNPRSPDLILEEGQMYFLKIGGSFERIFYRAHWRSDISRFHDLDNTNLNERPDLTEALKRVHEYVLRVPPESAEEAAAHPELLQQLRPFHTAELPDPNAKGGASPIKGWGVSIVDPHLFAGRADGKAADAPVEFRYGLSPFYFAYVEYKRCVTGGTPTASGMNVIDGYPSMSLRLWCRDDLYYTQSMMIDLFGPDSTIDMLPAAELSDRINEMRDCLRNVAMIAPVTVTEFQKHLAKYPMNENIHRKHILETEAYDAIGKADSKLLDALVKWQNAGRKTTPEVRNTFVAALPAMDEAIAAIYRWVNGMYPIKEGQMVNPDRYDFEKYANAIKAQEKGIQAMASTEENQPADTSFLSEENQAVER